MFGLLSYLRQYLFGLYVSVGTYFKNLFVLPDYTIYKTRVIFDVTPPVGCQYGELPYFWQDWEPDTEEANVYKSYFYHPASQIESLQDVIETAPSYVDNIIFETTFWYRGDKKTYQSKTSHWPPPECMTRSPSFTVPIKCATLVTLEETENVTYKIKKFSGPFGDFYGKKINPRDFFLTWEPADITHYDFLEITNVLGQKKQYPIE
jgi:hypothetical protein